MRPSRRQRRTREREAVAATHSSSKRIQILPHVYLKFTSSLLHALGSLRIPLQPSSSSPLPVEATSSLPQLYFKFASSCPQVLKFTSTLPQVYLKFAPRLGSAWNPATALLMLSACLRVYLARTSTLPQVCLQLPSSPEVCLDFTSSLPEVLKFASTLPQVYLALAPAVVMAAV